MRTWTYSEALEKMLDKKVRETYANENIIDLSEEAVMWLLEVIASKVKHINGKPCCLLLPPKIWAQIKLTNTTTPESTEAYSNARFFIIPFTSPSSDHMIPATLWSLLIGERMSFKSSDAPNMDFRLYSIQGNVNPKYVMETATELATSILKIVYPVLVDSTPNVRKIRCWTKPRNEGSHAWLPEYLIVDLKDHFELCKPWYELNYESEHMNTTWMDNEYVKRRLRDVWKPFMNPNNIKRLIWNWQRHEKIQMQYESYLNFAYDYKNEEILVDLRLSPDDYNSLRGKEPMSPLAVYGILLKMMKKIERRGPIPNILSKGPIEFSGCVIRPEFTNWLLETDQSPPLIQTDSFALEQAYYRTKSHVKYASLLVTRDPNYPLTLIGVEWLWSLVMSSKESDDNGGFIMQHTFYNPVGTINADETKTKAKKYMRALENFLGIGSRQDGTLRFRQVPCFKFESNQHTSTCVIECMRFDLKMEFSAADSKLEWDKLMGDDKPFPNKFHDFWIKERKWKIWSKYAQEVVYKEHISLYKNFKHFQLKR